MVVVGDRVFPSGRLARVVQAEVAAQGIATHSPTEGPVESGEVDGGCERETDQVCKAVSILQENLKMNKQQECMVI